MDRNFLTYWHTVRYLKPIQFIYRLKYALFRNPQQVATVVEENGIGHELKLICPIPFPRIYQQGEFEFLNLHKSFERQIDWEYAEFGRLWTYNLNYFEFINQEGMSKEEGCQFIEDFLKTLPHLKTGLEPYPLSLRTINWIRFFIQHHIVDKRYDASLYAQLSLLPQRLEYHLLGNHLLENGFALLFGAYYFNDLAFYRQARKILVQQLEEQVLSDGAHFELSPMYHSIMLLRMLDCYNLVLNNELFGYELKELLERKCKIMLGWLEKIVFDNGDIPLLNDAAFHIAPTYSQLKEYAGRLNLLPENISTLKECGYRKFKTSNFELIADVGNIGPDYQPGHAHADTFSFELHVNDRPVIVDTGISTYEVNATRFYERSTHAHNTVVIGDHNSSSVWGGHRVAQRAKVTVVQDKPEIVKAFHDGYKTQGEIHSRSFRTLGSKMMIEDNIKGEGKAYLHFAPGEILSISNHVIQGKDYQICFEGATDLQINESWYAPEFNKRITNYCVCISFRQRLSTLFLPA